MENSSEELNEYGKYLDSKITEGCQKEYEFALRIRDELIKNYRFDMHKTSKLVKKLARKYPKKQTLI